IWELHEQGLKAPQVVRTLLNEGILAMPFEPDMLQSTAAIVRQVISRERRARAGRPGGRVQVDNPPASTATPRIQRGCRYSGCDVMFEPQHPDQRYCTARHRRLAAYDRERGRVRAHEQTVTLPAPAL